MAASQLTQAQKDELFSEFMEQQRQDQERRNRLMNTSSFSYGGQTMSVAEFAPKPKMRKVKNEKGEVIGEEPQFDENGNQAMWEKSYYVEIAHIGSSRKFSVKEELGKDLVVGGHYLFEGDFSDSGTLRVKTITLI